ncbi:MAG: sulfite exporter TauE/SafE family protein [Bauldia sp.]
MTFTAPLGELVALTVALVISGALSGLIAGLFGVGGGTILVTVLYQALVVLGFGGEVATHVAVATSVGIIVPTSIRSYLGHHARGADDTKLLRQWIVAVPLGALAGTFVARWLPGAALRGIFAGMCVVLAANLLIGTRGLRLGDDIPGEPIRGLVGGFNGFLSTLLGIGGGLVNNTFMTLYGRPMHQAVATSAGVGALVAFPGLIGHILNGLGTEGLPPFSAGYVNLLGVLVVMPTSWLLAPVGVRLAHALTRRQLEVGFGIFVLLIAIRFVASVVWG